MAKKLTDLDLIEELAKVTNKLLAKVNKLEQEIADLRYWLNNKMLTK